MKALTLHQPHAHLIGCGAKPFETRSWNTNHRGLLAIHAAKIQPKECDGLVVDPFDNEPTWLEPYGHYLPKTWNDYFGDLNHGGIEALVVLKNCIGGPEATASLQRQLAGCLPEERTFLEHAARFGDFSPGRFAWYLEPIIWIAGNAGGVVRGYQGLWTVPEKTTTELLTTAAKTLGSMICHVCGCTESNACAGGCHWAKDFLCSNCVPKDVI